MILIVDDYVEIAQLIHDIVAERGYYADFADTGEMALFKLKHIHYSLAIIDIMLPGKINGNKLAEQVKSLPEPYCNTPLVAMTGGYETAINNDLFVHVLTKPFLPIDIKRVVDEFADPPIPDLHLIA